MENVMKALWEIFLDSGRESNKRSKENYNNEVEDFYESKCINGHMGRCEAEGWKEYWKK